MASSIFKEAVQIMAPQKSKFDLSHERKLTLEMGKLVPIMVQEILPGDSFKVDTNFLIRLSPMLAPLFHRIDVYTHYFFVPNRIIWNEWETFITGGDDGLQAPVHPFLELDPIIMGAKSTLADYFGLPTYTTGTPTTGIPGVNQLPFRAYLEIYNEYYRDENLIPKVVYPKGSGGISILNPEYEMLTALRTRAWEKGYFNTAMPFAQRGNPAAAPVDYTQGQSSKVFNAALNTNAGAQAGFKSDSSGNFQETGSSSNIRMETEASVLITELRKAARLQEFLEAAARGGSRLTEWILHVFGVKSSDARLQRPEYLGGGRSPVQISEVLSNFQFSGDAEGKPQGNMAGHGISVADQHGFQQSFEEHGFVIGIMSVMPKENFYQGLERMWTRPTRFDYYIPQFAHLGEQEVKNKEVFFNFNSSDQVDNNSTFGYQSRYAEYKFKLSTIHGEFRDTLAYWHMARKFSAIPGLNQQFIECNPTKDIFAVPTEPPIFCNIWHEVSAIRPLPYFSNPKL